MRKYRKTADVRLWIKEANCPNHDDVHNESATSQSTGDDESHTVTRSTENSENDATEVGEIHYEDVVVPCDSDSEEFFTDEVVSSSEYEEDLSDESDAGILHADAAKFMVEENLSRVACNHLLALLRKHAKHGMQLPKDSRTLLNTPHAVNVLNRCGREYVYFGVRKALCMAGLCECYCIKGNVDGIPLYKSSATQ